MAQGDGVPAYYTLQILIMSFEK